MKNDGAHNAQIVNLPTSTDDGPPALLACPFCGGEAGYGTVTYSRSSSEARLNGQRTFHTVNCIFCQAKTSTAIGAKTQALAAAAWNRRA